MYYAFDRRWLNSTVTVTLVALNVVLYLASFFTGDLLHDLGVLDVDLVLQGEYRRLVTAVFLHADPAHLFSNMVLLFYIGGVVERNLGAMSYAALYLISGIAGNVMTVLYEVGHGQSWTSLGASGAVFGVMGAMLVLLFRVRDRIRGRSTLLPRVGFMVAYSLLAGFRGRGTNNIAHVCGLVTGCLICFLLTMDESRINVDALL